MCGFKLKKTQKIYLALAINFLFFISNSQAQISGCIDPLATNYNPIATKNDGSCTYSMTFITPTLSVNLGSNISETSGLIEWNNQLWTHNDSKDINIYALDTINGNVLKSYPLSGTVNIDWEEISQDENYIYIGDFGNNQNGNRTDLKILRINKNSVLANPPKIDTINFSYSDQINFNPAGSNSTNFDCEALIVSSDSIFLFTKQWINNKTSLYSLSKTPGIHTAILKSTLDVQGLITGAVYLESKKLMVLCGYSSLLEPFIYLLYDFNGSNYFRGNVRKIMISLPYHQIEGITTTDGLKYYMTNEQFVLPPFINIAQKLHIFDLKSYLERYLKTLQLNVSETKMQNNIVIYPNPANDFIIVKSNNNILQDRYFITNHLGQIVLNGKLMENNYSINISDLSDGIYILKIGINDNRSIKVIKRSN